MTMKSIRMGIIIPYPVPEEQKYTIELLRFVKILQTLVIEDTLKSVEFKTAYNSNIRYDDVTDPLELAINYIKVKAAYELNKLIVSLLKRAAKIDLFNQNSFRRLLEVPKEQVATKIGFNIATKITVDELKLWAADNARLIKSIPDQMLDKVAYIITEGVRARTSITALAKELQIAFNLSKNRAKFIARDQVAKLNGRLTRHRNLALGITEYKWLTSSDERVRESHKVLEGKICSWKDDTVYREQNSETWKKRSTIRGTQLPVGLDVMCRCTSVPVIL